MISVTVDSSALFILYEYWRLERHRASFSQKTRNLNKVWGQKPEAQLSLFEKFWTVFETAANRYVPAYVLPEIKGHKLLAEPDVLEVAEFVSEFQIQEERISPGELFEPLDIRTVLFRLGVTDTAVLQTARIRRTIVLTTDAPLNDAAPIFGVQCVGVVDWSLRSQRRRSRA